MYHIIKQSWNQFLLVVKAPNLKQRISKFYPQIQRTDASDHIYVSQWPVINVALLYLEFADKILTFAVLQRWLLQLRETDSSFIL